MHWSDEGIVLGARRQGESGAVLELLTRSHGRHTGLVHGGRSRRLQPVLQPGNTVQAVWRARLDEHLGTYIVEPARMRSAELMGSPLALYGMGAMTALLRLLPERDPHPGLYQTAEVLLDNLADPDLAPALFVRFELTMLAELGFGLDLARCAATGRTDNLAYVSPKTGRAVSTGAAEPYKNRLLPLPGFLAGRGLANRPSAEEITAGFALTEHFLIAHVFEPRGLALPAERARFVARGTKGDL